MLCPGATAALEVSANGGLAQQQLSIEWSDGGLPAYQRSIAPASSEWWWVLVDDGCSDPAADSIFVEVLPPFQRSIDFGPTACFGEGTDALLEAPEPSGLMHIVEGDTLGIGPHSLTLNAGSAFQWSLYDPTDGCAQDTVILVPSHPPLSASFSNLGRVF